MMNATADTTYIISKVHALHDFLLKYDDYREIVSTRSFRKISPAASYTIEKDNYIAVKEALFRNQIEKIIFLALINTSYRNLFRAFFFAFDAINIKQAAAHIFSRTPLTVQWFNTAPFSSISRDMLNGDFNAADLLQYLESIGIHAGPLYHRRGMYERIASSIDAAVLTRFLEFGSELSPSQAKGYYDIILRFYLITLRLWKRRLKYNYSWTDEQIEEHLAPVSSITHGSGKLGKITQQIDSHLDVIIKKAGTALPHTAAQLSSILMKACVRHSAKIYHSSFHSVSCVVSFLLLLYFQIHNIFRIVEGLRFLQTPESVLDGILCEA